MIKNRTFRIELARSSHYWFFHFYLRHYVKHQTADFHRDIYTLTEKTDAGMIVITAFRNSSKSTICTLSFPLWAILGVLGKKFVVIVSQTQNQARFHLSSIRDELEQNPFLRQDLGPFRQSDEWGSHSLVIPRYNARIIAASTEQGIRGIRHLQYRPDVIIADDIEDSSSVRTQEGRNKTFKWFKGDLLPAGTTDTKVIVIGNLLHEDGLLRRLQSEIEADTLKGIYREYPLIDDHGQTLWPGKFPTQETLEAEEKKYGAGTAWLREFLLKIVPEEDQVVHNDWIHYYDDMPPSGRHWTKVGVDLAISLKTSADYTAMVVGSLYGWSEKTKLYIHPFPVNARMDFPSTVEKAKQIADTAHTRENIELLIEEVAYQKALSDQLKAGWHKATGVKVTTDKRSRLALVSHLIKNGNILFPRKGTELLINQIVGFGVEKHDDLMDAFVLLATHAMGQTRRKYGLMERPDKI